MAAAPPPPPRSRRPDEDDRATTPVTVGSAAPPPPAPSAPPPASAAPGGSTPRPASREQNVRHRFYGLLRDIRADAQDLDRSLQELAAVAETGSAEATGAALDRARPTLLRLAAAVETRLNTIRLQLFAEQPSLWDECGDEVRHIDNLWNRTLGEWPETATTTDDLAVRVGRLRALIKQLLFLTGRLTIPHRLNLHLESVRVGKALDFHAAFADEVPDAGDRTLLLQYLADHPASVEGVVDVGRGLVFRVAPDLRTRLLTYVVPPLAAVAGALLVLALGQVDDWLNLDDWPSGLASSSALLTGYLFVLAGAVAHVAVEALKQQRFASGSSFLALDDVLSWLHIRYFSIAASVLWVLIGLIGLAVTTDELNWATAFFVGFSLDSIGGLFLQRFGDAVSRGTARLAG